MVSSCLLTVEWLRSDPLTGFWPCWCRLKRLAFSLLGLFYRSHRKEFILKTKNFNKEVVVVRFSAIRNVALAALVSAAGIAISVDNATAQSPPVVSQTETSDTALVRRLPGFENGYASVNGVRIHYVAGGKGEPVVLLPGWPETWWAYNKVMPTLARQYRVISVDLRGMGSSDKPAGGYDKKNMAKDIRELLRHLGHDKAYIVGHDIGAQVAFSFAANHPESTRKLVMLDVPHPDEGLLNWPMLPVHGTFTDKIDERYPYVWWFAFHQVKGLPEQLLEGRVHLEHNWFFKYLLLDEASIGPADRAVYAAAYNSADAIRAGNAWYQAFTQDIIDGKTYSKLEMPVLGLAGPGYEWLKATLANKATNAKVFRIEKSGHFVQEEQPEATSKAMLEFFQ